MSLRSALFYSIIALIVIKSFSYCQGSHAFAHSSSSCVFYYNYTDENCTNFSLYECSYEVCTQWTTSGNDTYCSRYQTLRKNNWGECTRTCCDPSSTYQQNYASFQQCQDYLDYQHKLTIIIIASIFGGIGFIIIVIFCICLRDKIGGCICSMCQCIGSCFRSIFQCLGYCLGGIFCCRFCIRNQPMEIQNHNNQKKNNETVKIMNNVNWMIQNDSNERLKQDCCICLQKKPSLQLQCKHIYHRICIIECVNKKWQCILCRSKEIKNIRVYCQKCFHCFFQTTLKDGNNSLLTMQICKNCEDNQIYKIIQEKML